MSKVTSAGSALMAYAIEAVTDPTGCDILYHRVVIDVTSIVHPLYVASGRRGAADPTRPPNLDATGHVMGWTVRNLRSILMERRAQLEFWIGDAPVVIQPPIARGVSTGARRATSDARDGPRPLSCRVTQLMGDKSAIVHFRVETFVTDMQHYLLSNRWSMASSIDPNGYTTRTTTGRAIFRGDWVRSDPNLTADSFRKYVAVPQSRTMARKSVNVRLSEDGCTLDYTVVDREVTYGVATARRVARVDGNHTFGAHFDIKDLKAAANRVVSLGKSLIQLDIMGVIQGALNTAVPSARSSCVCRVTGFKDADKRDLVHVAVMMAADRSSKMIPLGSAIVVGAYCTQSIGSDDPPWVEVRLEFLSYAGVGPQLLCDPEQLFNDRINFDNEFDLSGGVRFTPASPAPGPPYSDGTRGGWLGALAYQSLQGSTDKPADPATRLHDDKVDADRNP